MSSKKTWSVWAAILAASSVTGATRANNVTTSFEFFDVSGQFTLGTSPNTVTFTGGLAQTLGIPRLYHSGLFAWDTPAGSTSVITFETPAKSVDFWFIDQLASNPSVLTVRDINNLVIATFTGATTFQNVVLITAKSSPIGSITLVNNSPFGVTALDDFTFCATNTGGGPIIDPIPAPIPPGAVHVKLVPVATGLTAPNWGTFVPGFPNHLMVTDQNGVIWSIDLSAPPPNNKFAFLDVGPTGQNLLVPLGAFGQFDERGLLGVAFHPLLADLAKFYTYTSQPVGGPADFSTIPAGGVADSQSVITEWTFVNGPLFPAESNSARELLRIDEPQFNHDGGALNFGSDFMLYISLGDGGGGDDQAFDGTVFGHGLGGNGQNPTNPLGTILRIDPLGVNSANGKYGIPATNPFVGNVNGNVEEIFYYGFRNPFRFSFDSAADQMYIGDVGQNDIEEIDKPGPNDVGGNFGWRTKEGTFLFDANGVGDGFVFMDSPNSPAGLIDPIAQYDHDEGIAIIGGFVYRGSKIPALVGRYVFGDFSRQFLGSNGRLFYLDSANQVVELQLLGQSGLGLSLLGFGQDANGEIYVMANATGTPFPDANGVPTGVVLRIEPKPGDLNANGVVAADDLAGLLGQWGLCPVPCSADLDMNGSVDSADLANLLGNWGP